MAGKAGSSQGKHGGRSRKLAGHISPIHRKQTGNRKWSQAVKSQSLPPSDLLSPAKTALSEGSITSLNSAINKELSVQT